MIFVKISEIIVNHQVVPPAPLPLPSSLPLHHTTNDHFPEDIRGYTHIPGPAPQMPRFQQDLIQFWYNQSANLGSLMG